MKLILASNSPRRRQILTDMKLDFEVRPQNSSEELSDNMFSYEKIEELALRKCRVATEHADNNSIIISADTVVVLDNMILGKPRGREDAFQMLKSLSGKLHSVVTSICGINTKTNQTAILSVTSSVRFNELTNDMINYYIENFKPFDKAGSYGIQELPPNYTAGFEGSYENIIGLCPKAVNSVLFQLGYYRQADPERSAYLSD